MGQTLDEMPVQTRSRKGFVWLKVLVILFGVLFVGVFFGLRSIEHTMTFRPTKVAPGESWKRPAGCEEVWMTAGTGKRVHGCFVKAQGNPAGAFLYAHGNAGDLRNVYWIAERLAAASYDVLLFDYEGYGRSDDGLPDETGLFADGEAAYDYLTRTRKIPGEKIVLYGQSLGTTVVTDVASRRPCGALVVESGLSSAEDMAATALPWLPRWLYWIGQFRFESAKKMAAVGCPVMVVHGTADRRIAYSHGQKLFRSAREPKKLLTIQGGGHWLSRTTSGSHLNDVLAFVHAANAGKMR